MKFFKKRVITREDRKPYLIRWNLFECRFFSIKIHKILLSDYDCQHDHPWAFISLILKGGYVEHATLKQMVQTCDDFYRTVTEDVRVSRIYGPGSILYRPAEYTHKLEIHQPCWTLVVTFRKVREWGFYTPAGWLPWRKYSAKNSCE